MLTIGQGEMIQFIVMFWIPKEFEPLIFHGTWLRGFDHSNLL